MPTAAAPSILVIFGASGDLAKIKLIPAIYQLAAEKLLPDDFVLLGYARSKSTDDEFRQKCREAVEQHSRAAKKKEVDQSVLDALLKRTFYESGAYGDDAAFGKLKERLAKLDAEFGTKGNRLFYMSTPPETFEPIITALGKTGLVVKGETDEPYERLIIEKPFGHDLETAKHLNHILRENFAEEQVFRIDHYLGKETVQNLMVLRFANSIFEPIWSYKYVDHVQITVSETLSADDRAGYYESAGALRDMVQNHIFQLMALVAMEPPAALDARSIRDEKTKLYKSIRPLTDAQIDRHVVRGQYGAGTFGKDTKTDGYLKAKGVAPDSKTETFVALKLYIDNWRWSGTPFYIRTGKVLPTKLSEVRVRFRQPPQTLFQKQCETPVYANDLVVRVAPQEGISLHANGKVPGGAMLIKPVAMSFDYAETFKQEAPEAYERLIFDALVGEQTLFIRGDEAEAAWAVIDPIERRWAANEAQPFAYAPNTWGPKEAQRLIEADGRRWVTSGDEAEPILACAL